MDRRGSSGVYSGGRGSKIEVIKVALELLSQPVPYLHTSF